MRPRWPRCRSPSSGPPSRRGRWSTVICDATVFRVAVETNTTAAILEIVRFARLATILPFMFIAKAPAAALGIARHAIDALTETAAKKPARRYTLGERVEAPRVLRDDVHVQDAVGRAETLLTSARAHVFDVVGDLWASLLDGRQPSDRQLALFATLYPHTVGICVEVVQLIYKAAGGAAVYRKGPLDRCLRDILTANQHAIATARTYEMAGRLLLGLEPLRWLF